MSSANYQIFDKELQVLRETLEARHLDVPNELDLRASNSMREHNDRFFKLARIRPLESGAADWNSERGWHDQIISISKRRAVDDASPWTGTGAQGDGCGCGFNFFLSYDGDDLSQWGGVQQERRATLTLASLDVGELSTSLDVAPITEIVDDYDDDSD